MRFEEDKNLQTNQTKSAGNCLRTVSTHTTVKIKVQMQYAVGQGLRNNGLYFSEMFIVSGVLLCIQL